MDRSRIVMSETNTRIFDSYTIRSKEAMRSVLTRLREEASPEMAINRRSMQSLIAEWRSHNFFYHIHVFRSRTKDVDLEAHQNWWREVFCRVVSLVYFW